MCTVQVQLVNARKLQRIQDKKYRALQARIFGYWEDNAASKISSWRPLKACSYLAHGPVRTDKFSLVFARIKESKILLLLL